MAEEQKKFRKPEENVADKQSPAEGEHASQDRDKGLLNVQPVPDPLKQRKNTAKRTGENAEGQVRPEEEGG